MAMEYEIKFNGQPLFEKNEKRIVKMRLCEPMTGVNDKTGILVLSGGFGSKMDSNVWRKMRHMFADKYNFITLQVDYFGYCYMNHDFITMGTMPGESADCYNEMGPIQAMDHLRAICAVIDIEKRNDNIIDTGKILFFGHSHGAYLAYLCNAFAPKLFSVIIENSAYLFPYYIDRARKIQYYAGEELKEIYHYYIEDKVEDRCIYDLKYLYQRFHNTAQILSFHGTEDSMVTYDMKREFLQGVDNSILHQISSENSDNLVFGSATHSLDTNFFAFFGLVSSKYDLQNPLVTGGEFSKRVFRTPSFKYRIVMEEEYPIMYRE